MADIIHFENVWEKAETLSAQTHKNHTLPSILDQVKIIIDDMKNNMDSNLDTDITVVMTKKLMGELLYIISAISIRENVDVYSALKEHIENLFK